jgi:hypothetical protein
VDELKQNAATWLAIIRAIKVLHSTTPEGPIH